MTKRISMLFFCLMALTFNFEVIGQQVDVESCETITASNVTQLTQVTEVTPVYERTFLMAFMTNNTLITLSDDVSTAGNYAHLLANDIQLWNSRTGAELIRISESEDITDMAVHPDDITLALAGRDGYIRLWDIEDQREYGVLHDGNEPVSALAFSPDGRLLASGSTDGHITLWELETETPIAVLKEHSGIIADIAFNNAGNLLAFSGDNIQLWDVETWELLLTLESYPAKLAFDEERKMLFSAGANRSITWWDVKTGKPVATLDVMAYFVTDFNANQTLAVSGGVDGGIQVLDLESGRELFEFRGHEFLVRNVVFSPDGTLLASAGGDGVVRIWGVCRD